MTVTSFPPVELASPDGVLCVGGDLEVESLLLAYRSGIFPWPVCVDDESDPPSAAYPLVWYAPPKRALLFLDEVRIPRSLRLSKQRSFRFTVNSCFEKVVRGCATSRTRKSGTLTWITEEIVSAYINLYKAGFAISVEVWQEEILAGGLYGVFINRMFAGESMFYEVPNASKLALCYLLDFLRARSVEWLDCQQLTPLLASFGAREVPRKEFMRLLSQAL